MRVVIEQSTAAYRRANCGSRRGFTMIEIAIALAVIGFALVAIIGVLPFAMNVQRENREETIINQDANVFLDLIRNGVQQMDDLTNYVIAITNSWATFRAGQAAPTSSGVWWYTRTSSYAVGGNNFMLTNGARIVGLLSMPKYLISPDGSGYTSNYVNALVRSMSGSASEKTPQDNIDMRDSGLRYRLISEVTSYGAPRDPFSMTNNATEPDKTNYLAYTSNSVPYLERFAYYQYSTNLYSHLHDVRLIFRWPVLPNGSVPASGGRQVYCTTATGDMIRVRDADEDLFFLRPTLFTTNSL